MNREKQGERTDNRQHHNDTIELESTFGVDELTAVSPLDGRYRRHVRELGKLCSEFGLIQRRVVVEIKWLEYLVVDLNLPANANLNDAKLRALNAIAVDFNTTQAERVRAIERETNHDVKAVEYFVKEALQSIDLTSLKEYVHFACTSEDINNLAYAMMLRDVRSDLLIPLMSELIKAILAIAEQHVDTPMLSRTHGQTASPTTIGKEWVNVAARLVHWAERLKAVEIHGKMNGAVGNFNAHVSAVPTVDWPAASDAFVEKLGFVTNPYTTQIEPHDWIAEFLNAVAGFNQVLMDFDRDVWGYISLGYFTQRRVAGEVGSSTMPHKVNPIDFENSEGNLGVGNALARHLSDKLLVSRWQRDLTDSTALRNLGSVFGYTVIAIRSALRGIGKLEINERRIAADLDDAWEVLSEAVQTIMRRHGMENPYEVVKDFTSGRQLNQALFTELLDALPLSDTLRDELRVLRPASYTGAASQIAQSGISDLSSRIAAL